MTFQIRTARLDDAVGILKVKQSVWPDGECNLNLTESVLSDPAHVTLVAEKGNDIAGFVDGFMTVTGASVNRWELDLIAVHPDFQRQGLAAQLMAENTRLGQQHGAQFARGWVEVNNTASQRTFIHCDYQTDQALHELYVLNNPSPTRQPDLSLSLMPGLQVVRTLNYTGIWLEEDWSIAKIRIVMKTMEAHSLQLAGSMVPIKTHHVITDWARNGFQPVAQFHCWLRFFT